MNTLHKSIQGPPRKVACVGFVSIMLLLLVNACAPTSRPRVLFPLPPDQPKVEFVGVYATKNDLPKSGFQLFTEKIWGTPTAEGFQTPFSIVADSRGRIFISDIHLHNIRIFDMANRTVFPLSEETQFNQPRGIEVDSGDNLYVADGGARCIVVFDPSLRAVRRIGSAQELVYPNYLALNERLKRLYVSDSRAKKIVVYDLDGKYLFSFGNDGGGQGRLQSPQGLAVDADNNLYIADLLSAQIHVYTADGAYVRSFGERGDRHFQFENPKDIAIDSEGNLWIVDSRRSSIYTYNKDGKVLLVTGSETRSNNLLGLAAPGSIYIDADDRVYVTDMINRRFAVWQYLSADYLDQHPLTDDVNRYLEEVSRKAKSTDADKKSDIVK